MPFRTRKDIGDCSMACFGSRFEQLHTFKPLMEHCDSFSLVGKIDYGSRHSVHARRVRQVDSCKVSPLPCMDPAELPEAYARAQAREYLPYKSNAERILVDLAGYIDEIGRTR